MFSSTHRISNAVSGTLVTMVMLCALVSAQASANPTAVTPAATWVAAPPASVAANTYKSSTQLRVFAERRGVSGSFSVDIDGAAGAGASYGPLNPLPGVPTTISGPVDSYLIHGNSTSVVTLSGSVTFDSPVVGLIVRGPALNTSDGSAGSLTTTYPATTVARGLDVGSDLDVVSVSLDRKTVSVTMQLGPLDEVRILTVADVTPPAPSITGGPAQGSAAKSTSASFPFSLGELGATATCALDTGAAVSCTSPKAYSGLLNGLHTFTLTVSDPSGNAGSVQRTWTVDTLAPAVSFTGGPSGPTSSTAASFDFQADEAGSTFACKLDAAAYVTCSSPASYTALAQGAHTLRVKATDPAGNTGAVALRSWTVDTIAPNTSITSGPAAGSTVVTSAVTFKFSSDQSQSTFECSVDGGAWESGCISPKALSGLADGAHTFDVRATDPAGNTDATPVSRSWTVDTTAPTVTILSGPQGPTASASATFTFSSPDGGTTFQCSRNGGSYSACTSPKTYTGLANGSSQSVAIRARDAAGNQGAPTTQSWTVDTSPPNTSITSGPSGTVTSDSASFDFASTESGSSFECSLDAAAYASCGASQTFGPLGNGAHTLSVRAVDAAGNKDATPASRGWTVAVSSPPPDTVIDSGPSGPTASTQVTTTFHAVGSASGAECRLGSGPPGSPAFGAWASCSSPDVRSGLVEGTTYVLEVRAVGPGGPDPTPATETWTVDVTPPDTLNTSGPAPRTNQTSATFSPQSTEPGGGFQCTLDTQPQLVCTGPFFGLAEGSHTMVIAAVDIAGNVDPTPAEVSWVVDLTAPVATIDSGPGAVSQAEVTFAFSTPSTDLQSWECRLDGDAAPGGLSCTSPVHLTGLSEGEHTFEVKPVDQAGNAGTAVSRTWDVDATAPQTSIDSGPPATTGSPDATLTFSSESGATFECRLDSSAPGDWAPCTSPRDLTGLSDGQHTFEVRAADAAGNTDASPSTRTWTVDTTPPSTYMTAAPSGTHHTTSVSIAFTGSDPANEFECRLDSNAPGDWSACSSPRAISGLSNGQHTFEVRAENGLGVVDPTPEQASWTVDTNDNGPVTWVGSPPAGGTQTNNPTGAPPDQATPVTANLTTPTGGPISITSGAPGTPPAGYLYIGRQLTISAPTETAASPLALTLATDVSGEAEIDDAADVLIFRNGDLVPPCADNSGHADPDPCVAGRSLAGGIATITALTSHASEWNFGEVDPSTLATVSGTVYEDINVNGHRDPGEPGINGRQVFFDLNGNSVPDGSEVVATTQTIGGQDGRYIGQGPVPPGGVTGVGRPVLPSGWRCSQPASPGPAHTNCGYPATVQPGGNYPGTDYGIYTVPSSMTALGDSMSRAFIAERVLHDPYVPPFISQPAGRCDNTTPPVSVGYWDCPEDSWSTGDNPAVTSHYRYLVDAGSAITPADVHNRAATGAKMIDLNAQAMQAVADDADYVTIGMGGSDACGSFTNGVMTPVADFRSQFETAMATLNAGASPPRVLVGSIANFYRTWEVLHANTGPSPAPVGAAYPALATLAPYATFIWGGAGSPNPYLKVCPSMMTNPTSMAQVDVDRRADALQRIRDFNDVLEDVCEQYAPRCRYDGDAIFNSAQSITEANVGSMVTFDYFHPNVAGQALIGQASNAAGFNWGDATPTTASSSGKLYEDVNNNGQRDSGEPGINGRTVYFDLNANKQRDGGEPSTSTTTIAGQEGAWQLTVPVPAGGLSGELRTELPGIWKCSEPASPGPAHTDCGYSLTLQQGGAYGNKDFGTYAVPNSMMALGDSLTRAFIAEWNFNPFPNLFQPAGRCDNTTPPASIGYWDCPEDSWSTGDNSASWFTSHYKYLLDANPGLVRANVHNVAVSGAKVAALNAQAAQAVAADVDYVTIDIGGNDACGTFSNGAMTSVADFQTQFETAMTTLTSGASPPRIFVGSVPNLYRIWEVLHDNTAASPSPVFPTLASYSAFIWNGVGSADPNRKICQSVFANPSSTAQVDVDRRADALQRINDFNDVLEQVCAQHAPYCKYDGDAIFNSAQDITKDNVASLISFDYFHLNPLGEAAIGAASYSAGFNWGDVSPSHATAQASGTLYEDININGQQNSGEPGINGRTVYFDLNANEQYDGGEPSTTTATIAGQAGAWQITVPVPAAGLSGELRTVLPAAGHCSQPASPGPAHTDCGYSLTLQPGGTYSTKDFGTYALPSSMAALGDSLTQAAHVIPAATWPWPDYPSNPTSYPGDCVEAVIGGLPVPRLWDCPHHSWATGDDAAVNSHYQRLHALNPAMTVGDAHNLSVSGATVADLAAQAQQARDLNSGQGVDYVTISIGPNDLCLASAIPGDAVTSPASVRASFEAAMATLMDNNPDKPRVFVASVANPANVYDALTSATAINRWAFYQFCGNVTGYSPNYPSGPFVPPTDPAVVSSRAAAATLSEQYSDELKDVCEDYAPYCKFDGYAANTYNSYTPSQFSTQDYWHPSVTGQADVAALTWSNGFGW